MIRSLALIAPLALLGLAACDRQAALTQAKEGDCFTVVGHEANGRPKLEKSECLTSIQAEAPINPPAPGAEESEVAQGQSPAAGAGAPNCPATPLVCPGGAAPVPAARAEARQVRTAGASRAQQVRRQTRVQTARSGSRARSESRVAELGQYERVYTPDYPQPPLMGAPPPYAQREIIPAPPPVDRYSQRGEDYAYDRREQYGDRYAALPPPPPPRRPLPPPPPRDDYDAYRERSESGSSYSRSESYSSSSSSRSSSSHRSSGGYGYGYGCPRDCPRPYGSPMAPMNGPHFPVDQDGFLTWRGKTR